MCVRVCVCVLRQRLVGVISTVRVRGRASTFSMATARTLNVRNYRRWGFLVVPPHSTAEKNNVCVHVASPLCKQVSRMGVCTRAYACMCKSCLGRICTPCTHSRLKHDPSRVRVDLARTATVTLMCASGTAPICLHSAAEFPFPYSRLGLMRTHARMHGKPKTREGDGKLGQHRSGDTHVRQRYLLDHRCNLTLLRKSLLPTSSCLGQKGKHMNT